MTAPLIGATLHLRYRKASPEADITTAAGDRAVADQMIPPVEPSTRRPRRGRSPSDNGLGWRVDVAESST
jgi:hypothetical protein